MKSLFFIGLIQKKTNCLFLDWNTKNTVFFFAVFNVYCTQFNYVSHFFTTAKLRLRIDRLIGLNITFITISSPSSQEKVLLKEWTSQNERVRGEPRNNMKKKVMQQVIKLQRFKDAKKQRQTKVCVRVPQIHLRRERQR